MFKINVDEPQITLNNKTTKTLTTSLLKLDFL